MRAPLTTDAGTRHRVAAVFALAFATAAITAFAGVFAIDLAGLRLSPVLRLELLPESTWPALWLPGATEAASQQQAAAQQWLRLVLVLGAITVGIACINALIGLISHANERRYETALRSVLGAPRRILERALSGDALINAVLGTMAGVPAGLAAAALLRRAWPLNAAAPTSAAWTVLAFSVCLTVAAFAARITARRFGRRGWLNDALAPEARSIPGYGAEDLRSLLATAQLACAVALTTVSLLVWSYASTATSATAHTNASMHSLVASVALPGGAEADEMLRAQEEVRRAVRNAGVDAESIASPGALLGIGKIDKVVSHCGNCVRANMFTPLFPVETQQHVVGSGFFATAGIAVRAGSEFTGVQSEADKVVINRTFARLAFDEPVPIGKRILVGGGHGAWYEVIGIVDDVRTSGLQAMEPDPAGPQIGQPGYAPAVYFSSVAHPPARFDVVVRTRNAGFALAGLDFRPLSDLLLRANVPQRWFSRVLLLLGLLLCGAAMIGSFITTMLNVQSRRVEIAVRRALGATRLDIWRLVYGSVARLVLHGVMAGVVISLALARAIELVVPGLPAFRVQAATIVCAGFAVIAFAAALAPLRTALRIPPAQAHN